MRQAQGLSVYVCAMMVLNMPVFLGCQKQQPA
ncbi:hypothetical protein PC114_g13850 [Phytophthora cactorum]|nr:hypothetical protein PC114_g13850 [Phytophthora cactorum]KAG3159244.1 hypothetical protein C6341_g14138 [Phytophthora cactorum]KAG3186896.1 hypothetical protein PC128_g12808 [Phytophthora cactorum]